MEMIKSSKSIKKFKSRCKYFFRKFNINGNKFVIFFYKMNVSIYNVLRRFFKNNTLLYTILQFTGFLHYLSIFKRTDYKYFL